MIEYVLHGSHINPRWLEQFLAHGPAQLRDKIADFQTSVLKYDFANQAVTVGMQPGARQTENRIAWLDAPAIDDVRPLDHTNAEAGQIIIPRPVKIGQDRRLAADERAIRLHAPVANSFDQVARQRWIVLRHGQIVEKD